MSIFTPQTTPIIPTPPIHLPIVRVVPKGLIFSREAIELLRLKSSSRIYIDHEFDNIKHMYVRVSDALGYPITYQNRRGFVFSRSLSRAMLRNADISGPTAAFNLGEPVYNHIGHFVVPLIPRDYAKRD